jgi:hypothetical protein
LKRFIHAKGQIFGGGKICPFARASISVNHKRRKIAASIEVFWEVIAARRTNYYKFLFFTYNNMSVRTLALQPGGGGCSAKLRRTRIAKAGRPPAQAAAK